MNRKEMIDRIWALINPTISGYGDFVDRLLRKMTDEQIKSILEEMED